MIPFSRLLFALALALTSAQAQNTSNPFPNPIPLGSTSVDVRDFAVIPDSGGQPARVNQLLTAPNGRLFVIDQRGPIHAVSADGAAVTPYLDLTATPGVALRSTSEQGFQSMAFHPDFFTVGAPGYGKFYTAHTTSDNAPAPDYAPGGGGDAGDNVVLEWRTVTPGAATFVPADAGAPFREVLRLEAPFGNHAMGLLAFNPNAPAGSADYGRLYIAVGDGGSGSDPLNLAQNRARPYGKILRLDPLGTDGPSGKYGIPADNPFVGVGGTLGEIWALGLRNPQRFSWDRGGTGRMFLADIGQGTVEEINLGAPGANYGWREREGSFVFVNSGSVGANSRGDAATTGFTYPAAEYDHAEGSAATAGFVYRGVEIPALAGKFLFGDIANGRVFLIDGDTPPAGGQDAITELRLRFAGVERRLLAQIQTVQPAAGRADLRFGTDANGRIFLLNKQDGIVRVLAGSGTTPPAQAVSVAVDGKRTRVVSRRFFKLRGTASGGAALREVQVRVRTGAFKRANGTQRWRLTVRLQPGRNRVQVRAIDANGTRSPIRTIVLKLR